MIRTRHAWIAAALLVAAAIPTVRNVYLRPADPAAGALDKELGGALGAFVPGKCDADTILDHFGARDFVSREYGAIDFFAARTYDGKKLFHFPELALSYGRAATAVRDVEGARVIEFATEEGTHVAAYALLYGRRRVAEPIRFYLSILPEIFVGGKEPMTLVYVQGDARKGEEKALEKDLRTLLARAIETLRRE
jgi:hypothetical protein